MGENIKDMTTEELISKSLDEIDALAEGFNKDTDIAKSNAGATPDEVAEGAEEDTPPEEDAGADEGQPDTDSDTDTEGEEDAGEDDEVEKSLESTMAANENVSKALEVSEFLNELVKSLDTVLSAHTTALTSQKEDLSKSMEASERSNSLLAKSLLGITKAHQTIMKSQSELYGMVGEINKQLEELKQQPVVRKSVSSNAQPIEKSFEASAGIKKSETNTQTLTKSQASAKLMQAFDGGNADIMTDILALEGTGNFNALSTEAKQILGL